jgi:hypothetical protein
MCGWKLTSLAGSSRRKYASLRAFGSPGGMANVIGDDIPLVEIKYFGV